MKRFGLGAAFFAVVTITAGFVPAATGVAHAATAAVTVGDLQVVETDAGQGGVTVPVTLDAPAAAVVKVKLKITGGTAAKKTDYKGAPAVATIKKGQAAGFAKVQLVGDGAVEPNETLNLQVASVTGATVSDGTGVLTITDNDANGVAAKPEVRAGKPIVWEGRTGSRAITVPVTLSKPSTTPVTVSYDDACRDQTVVFAPGIVAKTVTVTSYGNSSDEADKTIKAPLSVSSAATLPVATGETLVLDDDAGAAALPVGAVVRASEPAGGGDSRYPPPDYDAGDNRGGALSANGRYVAFSSNSINLVPCDTNYESDVFVKDVVTGAIERVSVNDNGTQGNGESRNASISGDGRFVVFESFANNLVPNDVNGPVDTFIADRQLHTLRKLVETSSPHTNALMPSISANGRYVAFIDLDKIAGDTDPCGAQPTDGCDNYDVFVLDRTTNVITLVSTGQNGAPSFGLSPAMSGDGTTVAYAGVRYDSLPGTNFQSELFVTKWMTGATVDASVNNAGQRMTGGGVNATVAPSITENGRKVAFLAQACNFGVTCVPDRPVPMFFLVRDLDTATTSFGALDHNGQHATELIECCQMALSPNGRYSAFPTSSTALIPPGWNPGQCGSVLFERDLPTGTNLLVSSNASGTCVDGGVDSNGLSTDGSYVAFTSQSPTLVPNDANGITDLFVKRVR